MEQDQARGGVGVGGGKQALGSQLSFLFNVK